ncbi:DUF934 domain-containing protein [Azospirillum halopraeferens]|uniref:DUF934 domain-containing protein n=1 Tax=Azospirillum halopraeferens TaxID=34010 RepID=UPI00040B2A03|nr:DUF934 domain-containing protein [Azospirillum halopraeferens]
MPLVKDGRPAADTWTTLADDAPVPADGAVIVSLARWRAERAALVARTAPVGVLLPSDAPADAPGDGIAGLALIAVAFPKFRDGRGFTTARRLREEFGFTGTLRAVGDVLPDQYQFLHRCGFDEVELPAGRDAAAWIAAAGPITVAYQAALRDGGPLGLLRRRVA